MILVANSFFLENDPKQLARMKPYPPLATLLVAASLREAGHEVTLFDATFASGLAAFRRMLDELRPEVVGILEDNFNYVTKMCTVRSREATLAMVAEARTRGCRVAVNGSDASDHPELYLAAGAHAVLSGEADVSFPALARAWMESRAPRLAEIPGLFVPTDGGSFFFTGPSPGVRNLDALPLPAWDLVHVPGYRARWLKAHGRFSWNMVTSRGCPFGCNWCAKPIFGRRYAQRSAHCVIDEMKQLQAEVRPDHIWFADDIFGLTSSWIATFAKAVMDSGVRIPFMCQARADLMKADVAAALAVAGAEEVWLGVESGSQRILDAMEKGTTVDEVRAATRALRANGVRVCWFLQLGYPTETWDDVLCTRDLVRHERPDDIGVSVAYPLPGTKFHARVRQQLGPQRNWKHSDDLAMLFHGTYTTEFYRRLRDALHREVNSGATDHAAWAALSHDERSHRSSDALLST